MSVSINIILVILTVSISYQGTRGETANATEEVSGLATRRLMENVIVLGAQVVDGILGDINRHFGMQFKTPFSFLNHIKIGYNNEDSGLHVTQLAQKYGYVMQQHEVQTEDGYLLTVHRILPKHNYRGGNHSTVFVMHGLLGATDDWTLSGPGRALPYLLADRGYDVWLGNARGNVHSRRHVSLSPYTSDFWNFSWNEIGIYDLPAMIDYVLATTGQTGLKYIGHSQGTTSFFVMCSERPEYNKKIQLMSALSPVAWTKHIRSDVVSFAWRYAVGTHEVFPRGIVNNLGPNLCGKNDFAELLCSQALFLLFGFSAEQMDPTTQAVMLGHWPSGSSSKQFAHYGQGIWDGGFRKFDYGSETNLRLYGQVKPPSYPVDRVSAPVALFYSDNDWLASPVDVEELKKRLPNNVQAYRIPRQQFNHMDFLWGKQAPELLYYKIFKLMEQF